MNVLMDITDKNYVRYFVTVQSIIDHEPEVTFYAICVDLSNENKLKIEEFIRDKGKVVYFLGYSPVDKNSPLILDVLDKLPMDIHRIVYFAADTVILEDISDFYDQGFEDKLIVARSQRYNSAMKKIGARPENGQLFDKRVLLIDVDAIRKIDVVSILNRVTEEYGPIKTEQGRLNCFFENFVKYEIRMEYNFRYSIYIEAERTGADVLNFAPRIISFERRDYFNIGRITMPWEVNFSIEDLKELEEVYYSDIKYDIKYSKYVSTHLFNIWNDLLRKAWNNSNLQENISHNTLDIIRTAKEDKSRINKTKTGLQIINRIEKGEMVSPDELSLLNYGFLCKYIDSIQAESAVQIMNNLFQIDIRNISEKEKIKMGIVVHSSSEWQCEALYRRLEKDERFEVYLLICSQDLYNEQVENDIFEKTIKFFDHSYRIISLIDNPQYEIDQLDSFDLLIYFMQFSMKPFEVNIQNRHLGQLCIDIPYGIDFVNKDDVRYGDSYYNIPFFKVLWRLYSSSHYEERGAVKRQRLKGYNIKISGFVKMDEYLTKSFAIRDNLWKTNDTTVAKIIWAPHFNNAKGMNGTFYENYMWFLNYARTHKEISWIVRPHPRIKQGLLQADIFESIEEIDDYFDQWNVLGNAKVIDGGGYFDIFYTSDAMILDSMSFVSEYQFTGKPLLFLESKNPRFLSEWGNTLMQVVYKTRGNNYKSIGRFIDDVIQKKDEMRQQRIKLINENLNYLEFNGELASDFIYNDLIHNFQKRI